MSTAVALVMVAAIGCTPTDEGCDTGDCRQTDGGSASGIDSYQGDTAVEAWSWSCNATAPAVYWYDVRTVGWSTGALIEITETGIDDPWSEVHSLPSVEYDPHRYWDRLNRKLDILDGHTCFRDDVPGSDPDSVPCRDLQTADETTLYLCEPRVFAASLTWKLSVLDDEGAESLPCITWGADPTIWPECTEWQ